MGKFTAEVEQFIDMQKYEWEEEKRRQRYRKETARQITCKLIETIGEDDIVKWDYLDDPDKLTELAVKKTDSLLEKLEENNKEKEI